MLAMAGIDLGGSIAHLIKLLLADKAAALDGHGKDLWFPHESRRTQGSSTAALVPPIPPPNVEDDATRRAMAATAAANFWED